MNKGVNFWAHRKSIVQGTEACFELLYFMQEVKHVSGKASENMFIISQIHGFTMHSKGSEPRMDIRSAWETQV